MSGREAPDPCHETEKFYSSSKGYMARLERNGDGAYPDFIRECSRDLPKGAEMLECGCGLGHCSSRLAAMGFSVTGVDISSMFIDAACKKYGELPNLRFMAKDASAMPFPDRSFDAVCSALFMEHVTDVEKVLREMERVLRDNGRLVINMPSFLDPFQQLAEFLRWEDRPRPRPWEASTRYGALYNFFRYLGIKLAKAAGFNRKIYYLRPVLSEAPGECGLDFDATWLSNSHDVEGILRRLGMKVQVSFPDTGSGGTVARRMRLMKFPAAWVRAYENTRASGFIVTAVKPGSRHGDAA